MCGDNAQIQKIYSSSYYISFQIRIPSKNLFVFVGRGHGIEGVWCGKVQIPSSLRKKDRFLEYLRKHIAGCRLLNIQMDDLDRGFKIIFSKWRRECELYFHYSGRDLYFQTKIWSDKKNNFEYFQSWKGKVDLDDMSYENFNEMGRKEIEDKETLSREKTTEQLINEELNKASSQGVSSKSKKFLKRKLKNIEGDLKRVRNYKDLEKIIDDKDFAELETKTKIFDVKFNFKTESRYSRRDEVFKKIKKLKKAEEILRLRLIDTEIKLNTSEKELSKEENKLKVIEPIWKIDKKEAVVQSVDEYFIEEFEGLKVGVGKSSKGNDQLRSKFASKDDWWFHLSDRPSSHIVVKGLEQINGDVLNYVGERFCLLESCDEADLVYTQIRHLKSIKGKSGLVKYKKEKYFRYSQKI